jgi:Trk-type K+ transport system membrane component
MMLVGRLEMFSALVIFYPSFWKNRKAGGRLKGLGRQA